MNASTILHAAIGVLHRRGRCIEQFEAVDGRVCQLGALAVAAGWEPDLWMGLRDLKYDRLDVRDRILVDAARLLAEVEAPLQPVYEMTIEQLVMLLGDSNDAASDVQIFDFLTRAARLADDRLAVRVGAAA